MSGHSKWSNIKHKKAATDKKRAAIFNKLAKSIAVASAQAGGDPETNYALRSEIEKARDLNMPKDKIEQAIKRGTGELKEGKVLEELLMECFGPGGVAILVDVITDNRNRANAEIKHIFSKFNSKVAGKGSVKWMFDKLGFVNIPVKNISNKDVFELNAIDAGAQDIIWPAENEDSDVVVYTDINNLQNMSTSIKNLGYNELETGLEWVAKNTKQTDEKLKEKIEKFFEALDEQEDVQNIYTDAD